MSRLLLGAGALLALLLGFVTYTALSAEPLVAPTRAVVVAREELPPYTLFTQSNVDRLLTTRQYLVENVPAEALTQPAQAVGRVTTIRVAVGELILDAPDRLTIGEGGARASATIPRDYVAVTIPATEMLTVAGALQPGDRVDVIVTWAPPNEPPITRILHQDVRVFSVGFWQQQQGDAQTGLLRVPVAARIAVSSVTLLLDSTQAAELQFLTRSGGDIALALRRLDQFADVSADPITTDSMRAKLLGSPAPAPSP
jgi:Flp pilus assembly protein CpaB